MLSWFIDSKEYFVLYVSFILIDRSTVMLNNPVPFLHHVIPVIQSRFVSQEDNEPSEEIRLELIKCLALLIDMSGLKIAPYTHDAVTILKISLIDSYPEVKKVLDSIVTVVVYQVIDSIVGNQYLIY